MNDPVRIGLFSVGLDQYWPQFPELREKLTAHNLRVADRLEKLGAQLTNLGLVDTPEAAHTSGHLFRAADVDIIFVHAATYALSATVLPAVRRVKVPVVVLNLAPGLAIDYAAFNSLGDRGAMTGEWLSWCQGCALPEIGNVFRRSNIPFHQVTGTLEDNSTAWSAIEEWVTAARVASVMERNRLGVLGHPYGGMLDIYADLTQQAIDFGGHAEILEVEQLAAARRAVIPAETAAKLREFAEHFAVEPDCPAEELERAARTAVALDHLVEEQKLGSLAYYYRGSGSPEHEDAISSIIPGTSLLTARGVPVAGEYEIRNVQAMKILDAFDAGGSFSEYYAMDFRDDVVLMGHDGPGHMAIAEGKVRLKPLGVYHGKVGRGLSVEMSVRHGPVTLLSVVSRGEGKQMLLCAEGESVEGPILEIGNTNSRYRFRSGARQFVEEWNAAGPAHHCAIGVGHVAAKIKRLGAILDLTVTQVC